jgi:hypothetical protein
VPAREGARVETIEHPATAPLATVAPRSFVATVLGIGSGVAAQVADDAQVTE